jgi:8-amino-7-oxononanoate synthase
MENFPKSLTHKLQQRIEADALRTLTTQGTLVDFSSNDYLGYASNTDIFEKAHQYLLNNGINANGATGSRLITGNHDLYKETEDHIAAFHKAESALIFNSGYDANVGLFSSVPQKGDVVLYDEYIHASIRDGLRLSYAQSYKFSHNDTAELEKLVKRHENASGEIYIAVESVFSMDGDCSPVAEIAQLCKQYGCRLIVDEAHALGVMGNKGEGLVQHQDLQDKVFARVMTYGKGLGCHGAAVLGSDDLRTYLINFARSFIYTTGLPPHALATILIAYKHLEQQGQEDVKQLKDIVGFFTSEVNRLNLRHIFIQSGSAIHCAVIPGNEKVKNISSVLQAQGFNVKPILSPTVPQGQERLRFCLHSYNTKDEITAMLSALQIAHQ